jgi:sporulation protein YlmC with PRC-barrel domain
LEQHLQKPANVPHCRADVYRITISSVAGASTQPEKIMSYLDRDPLGIYKKNRTSASSGDSGPGPKLMGANTLTGDDVYNHTGESLGEIKEIMLDTRTGQVAYAVLSFGGVMGMGSKLFAVPWQLLTLDTANKCFLLDIPKERLESAPGFDKDDWPDMSSPAWSSQIDSFYGAATGNLATGTARPGTSGLPGSGSSMSR